MSRSVVCAALLTVAVVLSGCSSSSNTAQPTATPSATVPTVNISGFSGSWTSATTPNAPSSCSQQDYAITPTGTNSASVTYAITCGNFKVAGSGNGTLSGATLTWSATGTLSAPGITCPSGFQFTNSTATLQADNQVLVTYNGVVCGMTFNGSQLLKKK